MRGVAEQIAENLGYPGRVGEHGYRLHRLHHDQFVPPALHVRFDGFGRGTQRFAQVDYFQTQLDPAPGNAGDFQEVIDQAGQVASLARQDVRAPLAGRRVLALLA